MGSIGTLRPDIAPQGQGADQSRDPAVGLEAYFLRQVLAEVNKSADGLFGGGFAGGTFSEMLNEALADSITSSGGIGIAKQLDPALGGASTSAGLPGSLPGAIHALHAQ